jgi:hypothetical protein
MNVIVLAVVRFPHSQEKISFRDCVHADDNALFAYVFGVFNLDSALAPNKVTHSRKVGK